ncbi:MAG TPA: hypothetical protein VIY73_05300 [Polyangiaceae bacterium]
MSHITISLPIRTTNPLNGQTGNSRFAAIIRTKQRHETRSCVRLHVYAELARSAVSLPVSVRITRLSAGTLDAWDGLPGALKPVVDAVADAFGVRDDDARITWEKPEQRKCPRGSYGLEIHIEARA